MKRRERLPELLAPAGNFEALIAAVDAGADAVYVGGKSFGARAFAENFDIEALRRAVIYTHLNSVKLFVTVNTLVYDKELDALSDYVRRLYEIGVDAIISADLGVVREIRRAVPEMEIHASTQASIHNTLGADIAFQLGAKRVVLARELSLSEISSVTAGSKAEIEVFLHGALCVCYSGQCLFSALVGGRSGNRGECAQPCRLPYNDGKYPLSLCDLSLANHVRELCEAGVSSLKIEGRMKSADYVYNVTSTYRRLLDEYRDSTGREDELLLSTFTRGGFTDKYFVGDKFSKMTGVRSEGDKAKTKEIEKREFKERSFSLCARASFKRGEASMLKFTLKATGKSAIAYGKTPEAAATSPLEAGELKKRLSKLGGTYFTLAEEDIEIELDEGLNLPPSQINALRRECVEELCGAERTVVSPKTIFKKSRILSENLHTGLFLDAKSYLEYKKSGDNFFDIEFLPCEYFENAKGVSGRAGIYLPPVIFDSEIERVKNLILKARELGVGYALIENLSHIPLCKEAGLSMIADFRLNISNSESAVAVLSLGVEKIILHPEITLPMARDIGGGAIVYGRIPLMLTERCFIKENFGCERCNNASLKDRTGASFPLMYEFGHRNLVLNSQITYMCDKRDELSGAGINHHHFIFTKENGREILSVLEKYRRCEDCYGIQIRRMGIRQK